MKPLSFLCISKEYWDGPRRARKHLLFEALQRHPSVQEILYVNPHYHRWRPHPEERANESGVRVFQGTFLLPGERFSWVRAVNRYWAYRRLRREIEHRPFWYTVFYDPWDTPLARTLKKRGPVLFDWTEDWKTYYHIQSMGSAQRLAVKTASAIIAVTETLKGRASEIRGSDDGVFLLPNATSWKAAKNLPCPAELSKIPIPRLGYLGHAGPWLDADLVASLAQARPEWHWVLVGHTDPSRQEHFRSFGNIHLLGQKPFDELQSYMAHCQVLVAPYRKYIEGDATKLYDYLTIGHPIVTSEIATAYRLKSYVRIAKDIKSWLTAIAEALDEKDIDLHRSRQQESLKHTWDMRASALLKWLKAHQESQDNER
jgi:glycosyltransferase involved in cell wall biosynthesis